MYYVYQADKKKKKKELLLKRSSGGNLSSPSPEVSPGAIESFRLQHVVPRISDYHFFLNVSQSNRPCALKLQEEEKNTPVL